MKKLMVVYDPGAKALILKDVSTGDALSVVQLNQDRLNSDLVEAMRDTLDALLSKGKLFSSTWNSFKDLYGNLDIVLKAVSYATIKNFIEEKPKWE